jgi:hypothetical protein
MNKREILKLYLLGMSIFISTQIFVGCGVSDPTGRMATQEIITPFHPTLSTGETSTNLPTSTLQQILPPTSTIMPTPSQTAQRTMTPTAILTWTPLPVLPTLSPDDAETMILNLINNNGNCLLPCWWGITPGVTPWNQANQFLATFMTISGPSFTTIGYIIHEIYRISRTDGEIYYTFGITVVNGIVHEISASDEITIGHQLNRLLENNGQPDETWLLIMPATPGGPWFYLVLYYQEQGILAQYNGSAINFGRLDSNGEFIQTGFRVCPIGMAPYLRLMPRDTSIRIPEGLGFSGLTHLFRPLQDVTDMSLADFQRIFRNADSTTCFTTPPEPWVQE